MEWKLKEQVRVYKPLNKMSSNSLEAATQFIADKCRSNQAYETSTEERALDTREYTLGTENCSSWLGKNSNWLSPDYNSHFPELAFLWYTRDQSCQIYLQQACHNHHGNLWLWTIISWILVATAHGVLNTT